VAYEQSKLPNLDALQEGVANLDAHLETVKNFGLKPIVAINKFATDTEEELLWLQTHCEEIGVPSAVSDVYEKGAVGGVALAQKVIEVAEGDSATDLQFTYDLNDPIKEKILKIATQIYGAANVAYSTDALRALQQIESHDGGAKRFPICMAKTQSSITDDPLKLGAPKGFTVTVDDLRIYTGAEFIVPICGGILLMPGLPDVPASEGMDIDDEENIIGLF
jgi:formate--tetrahydrofolate ligase